MRYCVSSAIFRLAELRYYWPLPARKGIQQHPIINTTSWHYIFDLALETKLHTQKLKTYWHFVYPTHLLVIVPARVYLQRCLDHGLIRSLTVSVPCTPVSCMDRIAEAERLPITSGCLSFWCPCILYGKTHGPNSVQSPPQIHTRLSRSLILSLGCLLLHSLLLQSSTFPAMFHPRRHAP